MYTSQVGLAVLHSAEGQEVDFGGDAPQSPLHLLLGLGVADHKLCLDLFNLLIESY